MDGPGIYDWSYCFSINCVVSGLYNWQTFLGAILALLAALGTAALVWLQIGKQTDQIDLMKQQLEDERARVQQERAGKLRAARGSLPGTLNEVCEYATELAIAFHRGGHFGVSLY